MNHMNIWNLYSIDGKRPGILYIFNHTTYEDKLKEKPRIGTEHDVIALQETFSEYKVINILFNDLTVQKLMEKVTNIANEDFTPNSSIFIAFLTHGCDNHKLAAYDGYYDFYDVARIILSNTTLRYLPKIFLIQACRGDINLFKLKQSVSAKPLVAKRLSDGNGNSTSDGKSTTGANTNFFCNDLYILHSTTAITKAFRVESNGTFFIQTFCNLLKEYGGYKTIREIFDDVMIEVQKITDSCQLPQISINTNNRYIIGQYCSKIINNPEDYKEELEANIYQSWIDNITYFD